LALLAGSYSPVPWSSFVGSPSSKRSIMAKYTIWSRQSGDGTWRAPVSAGSAAQQATAGASPAITAVKNRVVNGRGAGIETPV
jgi:hypothetical protein